jgi:carbonic anhydrase
MSTVTTQEIQQNLSPGEALDRLLQGNARFMERRQQGRDLMAQVEETAMGQFPFAAVLGCIDSRTAAEQIFDLGIGDVFNVRVAGNIVNEDVLGSLEYSCSVMGAKLVLVLGHTSCGAVISACNQVESGNITPLLLKIRPALDAVQDAALRVDEVAEKNVCFSIDRIRKESPILAEMEEKGEIMIKGAMYDVATGRVWVLD